jgi:hypothetical protein
MRERCLEQAGEELVRRDAAFGGDNGRAKREAGGRIVRGRVVVGRLLDLYQRTAGGLRRLLEAIGIQRRPRDVTPTLDQYLASTSPNFLLSK